MNAKHTPGPEGATISTDNILPSAERALRVNAEREKFRADVQKMITMHSRKDLEIIDALADALEALVRATETDRNVGMFIEDARAALRAAGREASAASAPQAPEKKP